MEQIILASQIRVGDTIRLSLKNLDFLDRKEPILNNLEIPLCVTEINQKDTDELIEVKFDIRAGSFCMVNPNTEVILVQREGKTETEYVYSWTMDYELLDPRDRGNIGGEVDTVMADSDKDALKKVREKCGKLAEIDWIYAIHHKVNTKKEGKR